MGNWVGQRGDGGSDLKAKSVDACKYRDGRGKNIYRYLCMYDM